MVVAVCIGTGLVALLRDVDFAADDGVDTLGVGLVIEFDRAEQIAVICHGDRGHFLFRHNLHQLLNFAGTVEEGVIGMTMKMNERCLSHFVQRGSDLSLTRTRRRP